MIRVGLVAVGLRGRIIGRVIDAVKDAGELDNTLIIYVMGDNGASGEGTLQGLANEVGVAANGVDESHEKPANPQAPSFIAVNKSTGKVVIVMDA